MHKKLLAVALSLGLREASVPVLNYREKRTRFRISSKVF
jgi:hypothetical protein